MARFTDNRLTALCEDTVASTKKSIKKALLSEKEYLASLKKDMEALAVLQSNNRHAATPIFTMIGETHLSISTVKERIKDLKRKLKTTK